VERMAGEGIFPAGNDLVLFNFIEGQFDGRIVINEGYPQKLAQVILLGNDLNFHAVDEIHGEGVGGGGHEI